MALRHIQTAIMEALTTHWRTTAREILSRPVLASLLDVFDAIAGEFEHLHRTAPEAREKAIAELRHRVDTLDKQHDSGLGRCWRYLDAVAAMYTEEARGVALLVLQNTLMPEGLDIKHHPFQQQGKSAERTQAAFTPEARAQLAALNLPGIDLPAMMDSWIEAGIELKRVDTERLALMNATESFEELESAVRTRWIKAVSGLRTMSEFDAGLDDAARTTLFERLNEAQRRASVNHPHLR